MKRWTLGGATLIVVGLAALTFRFGCDVDVEVSIREDVTPVEHRFGWDEEAAKSEATKRMVAQMPPFQITGVKRDNRRVNVRFWEYAEEIGISSDEWLWRQESGDCCSWGGAKAVNWLQCVQILLGQRAEFREAYPPYIYGISRVQIGGGRLGRSAGSTGAWTAKAVQTYGILAVDEDGVPPYSGKIADEWGYRGPPEKFIRIAKDRVVRTVSQVNSSDDVLDAILNGYPVTIASNAGFGSFPEKDDRYVGVWNQRWPHQMMIAAAETVASGKTYFFVVNSWSKSWGPGPHPKQNEPPGGFWITAGDCDRIVKQGDSFAFSSFDGFPAQELDFDVIKAKKAKQPKHKERRHARSFAQAL